MNRVTDWMGGVAFGATLTCLLTTEWQHDVPPDANMNNSWRKLSWLLKKK